MRGVAQDIEPAYGERLPFTSQVVGVVCASSFPDPELIVSTLRKGQEHDPHTVWVVRQQDRVAVAALKELGVEFVPLPLVPYWKGENFDVRRPWRDAELLNLCSLVVVFSKENPGAIKHFVDHPDSKVVIRGEKKKRKRKGRKPVDV